MHSIACTSLSFFVFFLLFPDCRKMPGKMSKPCITVSDFTIIYYQTVLNKNSHQYFLHLRILKLKHFRNLFSLSENETERVNNEKSKAKLKQSQGHHFDVSIQSRLFTRNVESGDYSSEIKISRFFSVFFTKSYKSYLFIKENDSEC